MAATIHMRDGTVLRYAGGTQFRHDGAWLVVGQRDRPETEMLGRVRLDDVARYEFYSPAATPAPRKKQRSRR